MPFVTRIARYELLDQADVRQSLAKACWRPVPSSAAGPERFATELGHVWLRPGLRTRKADGSEYASVQVRVVVTRRRAGDDEGHGRVLDGWLYELHATSVPAAACLASSAARAVRHAAPASLSAGARGGRGR